MNGRATKRDAESGGGVPREVPSWRQATVSSLVEGYYSGVGTEGELSCAFLPIIEAFAMSDEISEIVQAVVNVGRWWP